MYTKRRRPRYIGVGNFQQGDSAYVRGNSANLNTDGAGDGSPSMAPDSATIDSVTVVRGPIAVLYGGNSSITGAVVRQNRVPLGRRQTTLKGQVDKWGAHRVELDHTSPLGQGGVAKFFMTSRGGARYERKFMESFIRPGPERSTWAARSNIPALGARPVRLKFSLRDADLYSFGVFQR